MRNEEKNRQVVEEGHDLLRFYKFIRIYLIRISNVITETKRDLIE